MISQPPRPHQSFPDEAMSSAWRSPPLEGCRPTHIVWWAAGWCLKRELSKLKQKIAKQFFVIPAHAGMGL
jgi:hypothetical protein